MLSLKDLLNNWSTEKNDEQSYSIEVQKIWKEVSTYSNQEVACGQFNFKDKELVLEVQSNVLMSLLEFQKLQLLGAINRKLEQNNFDKMKKLRFRLKGSSKNF